jgi:hypothetical protein
LLAAATGSSACPSISRWSACRRNADDALDRVTHPSPVDPGVNTVSI